MTPWPERGSTILDSFRYAFDGFKHVLRTQRNPRIHLAIACLVAIVGLILHIPPVEWAVIVLTVGFVIVAETMNTVVEVAIDLVLEEYHVLAKLAKDIAAAAVLIAAITSVVVGMLIFVPHFVALIWG